MQKEELLLIIYWVPKMKENQIFKRYLYLLDNKSLAHLSIIF